VAPSADVGDQHAVFQPCHGTAPDIAGRGVANPVASILSGVMLLDYLAETRHDPTPALAARKLEAAVNSALASDRTRTPDLGGSGTTRQATHGILSQIA
jgi:3-isopropylmalate dehydrogenase